MPTEGRLYIVDGWQCSCGSRLGVFTLDGAYLLVLRCSECETEAMRFCALDYHDIDELARLQLRDISDQRLDPQTGAIQ